ncbi:hypothetical protein [Pseudooceanicola onchidii]|uniref:hypothetical protein n=1 Tax=Pseudooceanicola onchidii TaxID=2562279 RepID=UPI00145BC06C|nr:hypothetical protein [Pseudooceanicola onchidii]
MVIILSTLIGAVVGALRAKRRKGKTADILQYAVVHAIFFALIGLFLALFLDRVVL